MTQNLPGIIYLTLFELQLVRIFNNKILNCFVVVVVVV